MGKPEKDYNYEELNKITPIFYFEKTNSFIY